MRRFAPLLFALAFALPLGSHAALACEGSSDLAKPLLEAFVEKKPLKGFASPGNPAEAECLRDWYVRALGQELGLGQRAGYKVGLTSAAMREKLGINRPIWGYLLTGMLLPDGVRAPVKFAARPIVEADLVTTVKDARINDAQTLGEVIQHLADIRPFLELADLVVAEGEPLTAELVTTINVGARLGVLGQSVPLTHEVVAALPTMTVRLEGPKGVLLETEGGALDGHPLTVAYWLVQALKAEGRRLKPGELISLGSFGPPVTPALGLFTLRYSGLPEEAVPGGQMSVRVLFEEGND